MIYSVLSIRDRCANVFAQPFFSSTVESGIRMFRNLINDPQGGLPNTNPDDFDLFVLGTYDDSTASFSCATPTQVALGREMVKPLPLARG